MLSIEIAPKGELVVIPLGDSYPLTFQIFDWFVNILSLVDAVIPGYKGSTISNYPL